MYRLDNPIQPYAWGSRTAIAELLGKPSPAPGPEAELWLGAHPSAPSRLLRPAEILPPHDTVVATDSVRLDEHVAAAPEAVLGASVVARFGAKLPFLLKVLAADTPLSLQAHPDLAQAQAGFAAEERAGIPIGAAQRNYKDPSHKPELLVALTPFSALCGFRSTAASMARFSVLGVAAVVDKLREQGLSATFEWIMSLDAQERVALIEAVLDGCRNVLGSGRPHDDADVRAVRWTLRLAELYPGDPGLVSSLLLDVVELMPGEGIYLPARRLHAYLGGVGIEIMASSDNVLRGGLTPKHVDVPELLRVLDFTEAPSTKMRPRVEQLVGVGFHSSSREEVYDTEATEFRLSRLVMRAEAPMGCAVSGPEILLCTDGSVLVHQGMGGPIELVQGQSLFVPASEGSYVAEGIGTVFRARDGLPR